MSDAGSEGGRFYGKGIEKAPQKDDPTVIPVIPIVFIPGIMGSNLRVKDSSCAEVKKRFEEEGKGKDFTGKAWDPPSVFYDKAEVAKIFFQELVGANSRVVKMAKTWEGYGPKLRQVLLNPDTIEVDDQGFIPEFHEWRGDIEGKPGQAMARKRGWGTVHWDMYWKLLWYLERQLNYDPPYDQRNIRHRLRTVKSHSIAVGARWLKKFVPTDAEVEQALRNRFPVHAMGYNWTQSNLDSAKDILKRIESCIQDYRKAGHECRQVILVTHSMGGLVARVASQLDEKQLIRGVIHGVMPAIGAPLAYRRMVAGTEHGHPPALKELEGVFASLAGRTAAETTPVMANAPGALELLPSHLYPPGWLRVERDLGHAKTDLLFALPEGNDPYNDIYKQKDVWWRMVDPELIDPAGSSQYSGETRCIDGVWSNYIEKIDELREFHNNFVSTKNYHKSTYFFYGIKKKTFESIRWRLPACSSYLGKETIRHASPGNGDGNGSCQLMVIKRDSMSGELVDGLTHFGTVIKASVVLQGAEGDGDGTVPVESGRAPGMSVPNAQELHGYDHADAYKDPLSQLFVVMVVCKIKSGSD